MLASHPESSKVTRANKFKIKKNERDRQCLAVIGRPSFARLCLSVRLCHQSAHSKESSVVRSQGKRALERSALTLVPNICLLHISVFSFFPLPSIPSSLITPSLPLSPLQASASFIFDHGWM